MQAGSAPAQTIAGPVAPTVVPPDANTDATTMYTVVPGDTLSGIAVRYGVGLHDLMQANALVDSDSLTVGTRLIVPTSAQPSSMTVAAAGPAADGPHPSTGATTMYTVMPGDTLSGIAFRYGLGLHDLVQANNLVDTESLAAGTRLVVPTSAQPSSTTVAAAVVTPPVQLPSGTPEPVVTTGVDTPEAAVRSFYAHLNQADFSGAAGLWTAHMRKAFPPAQNIDSRFAQTQSLSVQRADVVALDTAQGRATVALRLTEVAGSPAQTRTYAGNWYLVRESSGWLLDQPDLHTT
ncbi:MAG: LysM peptidoglycan-binding domain-containing protein [Chloroflexi bacterium]|nr:LysM peptidoglycan-binding domain-containing protein [Chloroflexota bacterium]